MSEVKFKSRKTAKLNEDLFARSNANMDIDKKVEPVVALTPGYAAALNDRKDREEALEDTIGKHEEACNEIIDEINKDDSKAENKGIKKATLQESLFEVYTDNALAKRAFAAAAELTNIMTEIDKVDPMHEYIGEDEETAIQNAIEALNRFGDVYGYVMDESLTEDLPETKPATAGVRTFVKTQDEADAWRLKQLFKSFKDSGDAARAEAEFRASHGVPEGEDIIADDLMDDEFPVPSNWEVLDEADYSENDPWLAVYDELSNDIDQEAPGDKQQVNKKLTAKRHERYSDVRPYGDNDIIVYTDALEKLDFAKRVAEFYANLGVVAEEPVEHKSRYVPENQRWSMVFRIPVHD